MQIDTEGKAIRPRGWAPCVLLAGAIALVEWTALAVDATHAITAQLARGSTLFAAFAGYLRYFTIETNVAIAMLMSAAAWSGLAGRTRPAAAWYRAITVYAIVTGVTYELLLRRLWSPEGMQFVTDFVFHDAAPLAVVLFWLTCAPKRSLTHRRVPVLLLFPAIYFAGTLIAGAAGAGYPYGFLDAAQLGYPAVIGIGVIFLAIFYALGAILTRVASRFTDDRSRAVSHRPSS